MRALAGYIMRGPVQAVLVTAALALVSLIPILGIVSVLSGAALALVTLRHGARQGLIVLVGASVVAGGFMYFAFGTAELGLIYGLMLWLPLVILALVLRKTGSWSMLLDAAAGLALLGIAAFYAVQPDPLQFWQVVMTQLLKTMSEESGMVTELEAIQQQLPVIAEWLTGMLAAGVVLGLVASMMVARWWQAMLYNPGGFRQEFYALRQSKSASLAVLLILVVSMFNLGKISFMAGDMMVTVVVLYSIVGLALVHSLVAMTGNQAGWLVALYVLLFIVPPQVMVILASAGFADSWLDFRGRLAALQNRNSGKRDDNQ
jgi:hypothetical protein